MARRTFFVSVLTICIAGCTAQGEKYERPVAAEGTGTIFVYRPASNFGARGENPYVTISGESRGRLYAGGYVSQQVPAGEHEVEIVQSLLFIPVWPKSVTVAVPEGGAAYVRIDQKITSIDGEFGGVTARQETFIEEVDLIDGQAALAKSRLNE